MAVFVDNARKYSLVEVDVVRIFTTQGDTAGMVNLVFENPSKEIVEPTRIFYKGYQQDDLSEGFGFGLFWAKVLV